MKELADLVAKYGIEQIEAELEKLKYSFGKSWDWVWSHTNNKSFGLEAEKWASQIAPQLERANGHEQGFDHLLNGSKIEQKSARNWEDGKPGKYNPNRPKSFTFNQVKPQYSEWHLLVGFHSDALEVWFVPNSVIENELSKSYQHQGECYTLQATQKNRKVLDKYKIVLAEIKI